RAVRTRGGAVRRPSPRALAHPAHAGPHQPGLGPPPAAPDRAGGGGLVAASAYLATAGPASRRLPGRRSGLQRGQGTGAAAPPPAPPPSQARPPPQPPPPGPPPSRGR